MDLFDNSSFGKSQTSCLTSPAFFQAIEPEPAVHWFAPYKNAFLQ